MMKKKNKPEPINGLSSKDILKIRQAIRQIWHRSYPRRLCVKRATNSDGFFCCEKCNKIVPKIFIDHIIPLGSLEGDFLARLFCPSTMLQALCKQCHNTKTKGERIKGGRIKAKVQSMRGQVKLL